MRFILVLYFLGLQIAPQVVRAADELRLGADVLSASQVIDLGELPAGVSLLQSAGLYLRDSVLEAELNRQLGALQPLLANGTTLKGGYLLEVSLYVDEFGVPVVPGGQLLSAIGPGTEPVDALAEFLRKPSLSNQPPGPPLRDASYYIWVTRQEQGALVARTVPAEFAPRLREASRGEARRRDLLGAWRQSVPADAVSVITRADYWVEVERQRSAALKSAEQRGRAAKLTADMVALQAEMNRLYSQYNELAARLAREAAHQSALEAIGTVTQLVQGAMEAKTLLCSANDAPVTGEERAAEIDHGKSLELTQRTIEVERNGQRAVESTLHIRVNDARVLDKALEELYLRGGVFIPKRDPIPDLPIP